MSDLSLSDRESIRLGEAVREVQHALGGVGDYKLTILPSLVHIVPWRVRYERRVRSHVYRRAEGEGHSLTVAFSALAVKLREMEL